MLFVVLRLSHCATLFPYTTLFRSLSTSWYRHRRRGLKASVTVVEKYGDLVNVSVATDYGIEFSITIRSEEHTSELQSPCNLVCRLLLEKKKEKRIKSNVLHKYDKI